MIPQMTASPSNRRGQGFRRALLVSGLLVGSIATSSGPPARAADPTALRLVVAAGASDRVDSPTRLDLTTADLLKAVARGTLAPDTVRAQIRPDSTAWSLVEEPGPVEVPIQVEHLQEGDTPTERVRLTWILPGRTARDTERRFRLRFDPGQSPPAPWGVGQGPEASLELRNRERTVFRYNPAPLRHPNYPAMSRAAYIHPAFTPSGALITGDFSRAHPHHRGFFLAYTKTAVGEAHPDFWNLQSGTGQVHCERVGKPVAGVVTARIEADHRWEAKGVGPVLAEHWNLEAYDIPGSPYWLIDLTSTQSARDQTLEVLPHRYGGMAYRGPDTFLNPAVLDVLTSAGLDRVRGDQQPARWVDLTGPVDAGGSRYGGAMIADHPANACQPTVARIHPTALPFFSYVPAYRQALALEPGRPRTFRYRILIHDGHPDRDRDERVWRDLAEPPQARWSVDESRAGDPEP